jgi:hypothetical protein
MVHNSTYEAQRVVTFIEKGSRMGVRGEGRGGRELFNHQLQETFVLDQDLAKNQNGVTHAKVPPHQAKTKLFI